MKQTLLFSFCLFAASLLHAQDYEPMAIDGAHWVIFALKDNVPGHHTIAIKGDTSINGMDYKKVYRQDLQSTAVYFTELVPPYYLENESLTGAMRDDTAAKRVYYFPFEPLPSYFDTCGTFQDLLLYDFSQSAGDTVAGCMHYLPEYPPVIISIDTEFLWGKPRLIFNTGFVPVIGGIGTGMGPFWPVYSFFVPESPVILVDYCTGTDEKCNLLPVSTGEIFNKAQFRVYPNPATDKLAVELPEDFSEPFALVVSDATGRVIHRTSQREIEIAGWPGGLYWLTVKTSRGVSSRRFVKN